MLKGLNLGWGMESRDIIVESDCKSHTDSVLGEKGVRITCSATPREIKRLLALTWNIKLQFIQRECNQLADTLTKMGLTTTAVLDIAPQHARTLVNKEVLESQSPVF
ncbi:uncharacterized protein LOC114724629 [Neltuma alba]|uniref:uncharacterized protein LOC114724629 n=1 Tax=Neltuma alba TaxID=207710 RepID=UPI0010A553C6|nr:uncharacterized protein LOC114724629 [Prosopis alba]